MDLQPAITALLYNMRFTSYEHGTPQNLNQYLSKHLQLQHLTTQLKSTFPLSHPVPFNDPSSLVMMSPPGEKWALL